MNSDSFVFQESLFHAALKDQILSLLGTQKLLICALESYSLRAFLEICIKNQDSKSMVLPSQEVESIESLYLAFASLDPVLVGFCPKLQQIPVLQRFCEQNQVKIIFLPPFEIKNLCQISVSFLDQHSCSAEQKEMILQILLTQFPPLAGLWLSFCKEAIFLRFQDRFSQDSLQELSRQQRERFFIHFCPEAFSRLYLASFLFSRDRSFLFALIKDSQNCKHKTDFFLRHSWSEFFLPAFFEDLFSEKSKLKCRNFVFSKLLSVRFHQSRQVLDFLHYFENVVDPNLLISKALKELYFCQDFIYHLDEIVSVLVNTKATDCMLQMRLQFYLMFLRICGHKNPQEFPESMDKISCSNRKSLLFYLWDEKNIANFTEEKWDWVIKNLDPGEQNLVWQILIQRNLENVQYRCIESWCLQIFRIHESENRPLPSLVYVFLMTLKSETIPPLECISWYTQISKSLSISKDGFTDFALQIQLFTCLMHSDEEKKARQILQILGSKKSSQSILRHLEYSFACSSFEHYLGNFKKALAILESAIEKARVFPEIISSRAYFFLVLLRIRTLAFCGEKTVMYEYEKIRPLLPKARSIQMIYRLVGAEVLISTGAYRDAYHELQKLAKDCENLQWKRFQATCFYLLSRLCAKLMMDPSVDGIDQVMTDSVYVRAYQKYLARVYSSQTFFQAPSRECELNLIFHKKSKLVEWQNQKICLNKKRAILSLFEFFCDQHPRILTPKEIFTEIWKKKFDPETDVYTVRMGVSRLRNLFKDQEHRLILYQPQLGYGICENVKIMLLED